MKHIITIILSLFLSFGAFASENNLKQSPHSLNWRGIVSLENQKTLVFDNSSSLDESNLPYFTSIIPLTSNQELDSLTLKNIVFGDFTVAEKSFIEKQSATIPGIADIQLQYLTERKEKRAFISFLPIIRHQGVLKKIISFDLSYSIITKPTLRSTATLGLHQHAAHSVLQTGKWVKIAVSQTGVHKISYADLVSWGIPDPANAHIFGYGGAMLNEDFSKSKYDDLPQLAVWKEKGLDGIFNEGDYLLFYAQGPVSWKYSAFSSEYLKTLNPYSFLGYYFISSDVGAEKTIDALAPLTGSPTISVTNFQDYQVYERELTNIISSGKEWYGEEFSGSTSQYTFPFTFPNIDITKTVTLTVDAAARASIVSYMSPYLNGVTPGIDLSFSAVGDYDGATKNVSTYFALPTSSTLNVKLIYNDAAVGKAWLNYISVNAFRSLIMTGSSMTFRNPEIIQIGQLAEFTLSGAATGLVVWNITEPTAIKQIPTSYAAGQYTFLDSAEVAKEYVAVYPAGSFLTPSLVGEVGNQDIHGLPQMDMVIIAPPDFVTQAETLAQKHRTKEGISVITLTPEQIYNEFSSGTPDATAFRWLMKMFYDRSSSSADAPKSLLLFGDGTYDNRIIESDNSEVSRLLTYQASSSLNEISSYVTDDYFGLLDDSEGANITFGLLDIGIGRFPVSTEQQANEVVAKVTGYMDNNQKGYWKNRYAYIADDDDNTMHTQQSDVLVKYMETNYPDFQAKRYFLDTYVQENSASGESYPLAKESFYNLLNSGLFLVNYTGHGSTEGLASEKIISRNDIADMYNKKLPIVVTATCSFSRYDDTSSSSGEDMFLNPNGGAIALFSTTRVVFAYNNFELNKEFNKYIFKIENDKPLTLGEVMRRTKNGKVGDSNRLNFTLLADPALLLAIPQHNVVVTEITSNSNVVSDTIKALSTVTVKGEIQSSDSTLMTQFNGEITAAVYDKKMTVKTMANESDSIYSYLDRTNILFFGKATVVNGLFTLTFMVPKDIAYNYDTGRINLYAADVTNNLEAQGSFEDFYIGGSKSDFVFENNGPLIHMYLNSPEFVNGQTLDATPVLTANISDENGVNAVGGGIGHDLLLMLNNDPNLSYVLNDYYQSSFGDYRSGQLVYEIPTLADGSYSLSLRAWDLLNNSSIGTLSFKVRTGVEPTLYSFYAAPNPAETYVKFIFKHNQPQSEMNIYMYVYSLTGEKLWNTTQTIYADQNSAEITWDLNTDSGKKLAKGLYLYQIFVQSEENGYFSTKTNKLLVK